MPCPASACLAVSTCPTGWSADLHKPIQAGGWEEVHFALLALDNGDVAQAPASPLVEALHAGFPLGKHPPLHQLIPAPAVDLPHLGGHGARIVLQNVRMQLKGEADLVQAVLADSCWGTAHNSSYRPGNGSAACVLRRKWLISCT